MIELLALFILFISCQSSAIQKSLREEITSTPGRRLEDHSFDPHSPLISRVIKKPDAILEFLKNYDSNQDYSLYIPSEEEMKVIEDAVNALPPLNRKILQEKLVGFYFVNHLLGTGFTDFILDKNGRLYYFMAFNPVVFKKNLDEWLSFKDNTCFIQDNPDTRLAISINAKIYSFLGILLHESVHAVDYALHITPYVEPATLPLMETVQKSTPFIEGTWKDYALPEKSNSYPKRERVTFYKMNQGPLIPVSQAKELYESLFKTDFASLYGSLNWAEDLADFVMLYHFTEKMKNIYEVSIFDQNRKVYSCEPMKSEKIKKRFEKIQIFYRQ